VNTIANTNDQAQLVKFIVTPYTRQAGSELEKCTGINDTAYVWVEPTAKIAVTPKQDTICDGSQVSITLTSPSVPTRTVKFRYVTEAPAGVTVTPATGGPLDNNDILTNTIVNTNDQAQLVKFIVTPYTREAGSEIEKCTGINDTAYVWVEPTAKIAVTPKQDTICDGSQVNITLTSPSVPTRTVKFRYVTEAPAGVTVTPATGTGLNNNDILINTIANTNDQAQLVKFIVTPYTREAGSEIEKCTGINDTAYVWVEPTAKIAVTPKQDTICDGSQVNITLTSPSVPTRTVKFRYVTEAPAGVTVTPATGGPLDNNAVLVNTIANTNDQAQLVKFIVTPYTREAGSELEKCTGINDTAYVWVEPTAKISVTPKQDTICDGSQVNITLTSPSVPTRAVKFRYVTEAPAGVTVTPATGGPLDNNAVLVNTIANANDQAQLVKFIITPYTRQPGSELEKCTGINDTAYVWVEPTAKISVTPKQDTICDGAQVNITLTSPSVPTRTVKFRYVTEAPAGVTVTPATGTGLNNNDILTNTIVNTSDQAQLVKFIVTPYTRQAGSELEKCTGINDTAYVWVEPSVRLIATLQKDTICSGDATMIDLNSPSVPTRPVLFRFDTQVPFGLSVSPANGTAITNNSTLTETFINVTDTAKQVVFIITPYTREAASESEKCSGIPFTVRVWVEPTPKVELTPSQDTICTSLRTNVHFSTVTRSVQAVKFYYEARYNPSLVAVYYAKDTFNLDPGFPMVDSIVNRTSVPQKVTFIAYPYLNGPAGIRKCPGIQDSTVIWIAPTLRVMVDSISRFIGDKNIRCRGDNSGYISLMPQGGITTFANYDIYDLSYTWSTGETGRSISQLVAGSYSININDHFGCQDDSVIVLTQPDSVLTTSIIVIHTVSCFGKDGILKANTKGGTRDYDNVWIQVPKDFGESPPIHRDILYNAPEGRYILKAYDTNGCTTLIPTVWRDLTQPPAKSVGAYPINYGSYQLKCNGDSSGSWVTVNNSMTNITYHWTGPGFDSTFTNALQLNYQYNLKAGLYNLVYTDESNCKGELNTDMEEPDPLIIEKDTMSFYYGLYNVSCFGRSDGQINLNRIRGGHIESEYIYSWRSISGGIITDSTLRNQSGLEAGQYSVVVSDTFNCSTGETYDLIQPSEIKLVPEISQSIAGGHNVNCYGDSSGYIVLHPEGGDISKAPYQFQWQQGDTSRELKNLVAGDYIVTVTDGINCSISDTITIAQPDKLLIDSVRISDHNGFAVSCFEGYDAAIRIFGNGGTGKYNYNWSVNNSALGRDTSYIDNLTAGSYKLDLTDANYCNVSWTALLESPEQLKLRFENTNVNCTGKEKGSTRAIVTGGLPSYVYAWDSPASTDQELSGLDTGLYVLTVTDRNLCRITDTSVIAQNPPVQVTIQVTDSISCHNEIDGKLTAVVATGIAPYTYKWSNNLPTETISAGRGSYSVTVTDSAECTGTQSIVLDDPDQLSALVDIAGPRCFGYTDGSVTLGATGGTAGYIYFWNDVLVNGTSVDQQKAGSYMLRITDSRECSYDTAIIIMEPGPLNLSFDENNTVPPFCPDWQNGALAIRVTGGTPIYQFEWTDYPDEADSILNNVRENEYEVSVTDIQGCKAEGTFNLKAMNSSCLGIPTAFTPNYDFANDTWEINYINEDGGEANFHDIYPNGVIEVYDRLGSLVYRCTGGCPEQWNGEDTKGRALPVDSYYFIIQLNNGKDIPPIKGIVTIIK
jgi:gliding motility-associated-like protein